MTQQQQEQQRANERGKIICPHCAEPVPEESVWMWRGKWYCCEGCCRGAAGNG